MIFGGIDWKRRALASSSPEVVGGHYRRSEADGGFGN